MFTENKSEPGKYILYAVTARDFVNMQFYGIQTFFEIYKNLRDFNLLAKQKKFLFLIRLHPNISHCSKSLSKVFPYLKFHLGSLDDAVKKSFVTISFSSTVIEDTLNSGRPIILYDEFNRYSHYDSKKKNKRNNSIYFLNHLNDLERVINLIKLSDKIKFKDYISSSNSKKNIEKILKKFLFK